MGALQPKAKMLLVNVSELEYNGCIHILAISLSKGSFTSHRIYSVMVYTC